MNNIEEKLNNMKIPTIENDIAESILRNDLQKAFFTQKKYALKLRLISALSFCLLFFSAFMIVNPEFAGKINKALFSTKELSPESNYTTENRTLLTETQIPVKDLPLHYLLNYTSIDNPEIAQDLNPQEFTEEKTYLIRNYKTAGEENFLIVTEYDHNLKTKTMKQKQYSF
ncbi:MAG: hypothetical protein PHR06_01760 [Candidatus Cloacimonetes bacterium]|nr:hypothetical protein [Candidatus Cloacimonadota bacterium]